jgi:hypothetical protein
VCLNQSIRPHTQLGAVISLNTVDDDDCRLAHLGNLPRVIGTFTNDWVSTRDRAGAHTSVTDRTHLSD